MKKSFKERFWEKVELIPEHTCWIWTSNISNKGYGVFKVNRKIGNKLAHRISWTLAFGIIPKGFNVLHKCDNPPCVRPEHLFLGTHQDNMNDKVKKNRQSRLKGDLNPMSRNYRG